MQFANEWKKFLYSQHFNSGIRLTASVLVPAFILYQFNLLGTFFSVPLGAMCAGLTDAPGPYDHRKRTLVASLIFNFFIALVSGFLHFYKAAVIGEIIFYGIFFSVIGVYGNRISSIGTIAIFVFIFNIDVHFSGINILYNACWFTAGGALYMLIALGLQRLRPYRLIQQMLGENIIETANYLHLKAAFYKSGFDENNLYNEITKSQILVQQQQENLREIIFKTREITAESTVKGRTLLLLFLNTIDLFERIITSQQDYKLLHKDFDDEKVLNEFYSCIIFLSAQLKQTGIAVEKEAMINTGEEIDAAFSRLINIYSKLREENLSSENIEAFIRLRNILSSIEDISERIKQLQSFTAYDKMLSSRFKKEVDYENFITHNEINPRLFFDNLTIRSSNFRHGVRLTSAMLIGYLASFFFPLGHDYWILLTVAAIIKPAYSITKQRNFSRLAGTLLGAAFGFVLLYFTNEKIILFFVMTLAMITAYTFIRTKYLLSSAAITVYVLLTFYFLNAASFHAVLSDRIIDTAIGSVIAFVVAITVLPNWEHEKIGEYILAAVKANHVYFIKVSNLFSGKKYDVNEFKVARKNAFVCLANLSDTFQRMLTEPKRKQIKIRQYHQFVASSHLLTSYIASLSYYSEKFGKRFQPGEFSEFIKKIIAAFENAENIYEKNIAEKKNDIQTQNLEAKIDLLLKQRKEEIATNKINESTIARKNLLPLKTVSDQLGLIYSAVSHVEKILAELEL